MTIRTESITKLHSSIVNIFLCSLTLRQQAGREKRFYWDDFNSVRFSIGYSKLAAYHNMRERQRNQVDSFKKSVASRNQHIFYPNTDYPFVGLFNPKR